MYKISPEPGFVDITLEDIPTLPATISPLIVNAEAVIPPPTIIPWPTVIPPPTTTTLITF